MFDRNRKYDVSKAHQLPNEQTSGLNPTFNRINQHYNQSNAHINFGFNRSSDDQELNDLDKVNNSDKLDSIATPPPIVARKRSLIRHEEDVNFERGESIFFQRKSIVPELETVIKWDNLELEITAKGKKKKILDNVSGEVNNLEIQVSVTYSVMF